MKIASPKSPGQDSAGTRNLEAYDLYLRGMALWHTRNGEKLWQAVDLFNQAIAADRMNIAIIGLDSGLPPAPLRPV